MDRREFLKSALTLAALAPLAELHAKAGADGDKCSDVAGKQVTRRRDTIPIVGVPGWGNDRREIRSGLFVQCLICQSAFDRQ